MVETEKFDVVIIGGGVSGLTSGALFSRFGLKVCIIEMDARPGGYIAGFRRKDFRFDSAIHWLNQCGDHGLITQAFEAIGSDYPKAGEQRNIRRFLGPDMDFMVTNTPDELKAHWIEKYPEDRKGIEKFFRHAKQLCKSFDKHYKISRTPDSMNLLEKVKRIYHLTKFGLPFIKHIRHSGDKGMQKGLRKYFTNPELLNVFAAEPDILSCLIPISWAYSKDYQTPPPGGSQSFAEWLQHVIESYGNEVRFQSRVSEIILENNLATGVKYHHKGSDYQVNGDYVIAACDVEALYERMLPKGIASEKMLSKLRGAELYASAVTLSIGLDCTSESLGFGEEIIYLADPNQEREALGSGDPQTSGMHILAPSVRDKTLAPDGKGTLTVFIPGFIDQFDQWKTTLDENGQYIRTDEYKALKEDIADQLLVRIEKSMNIELKKHIEYLDIATPVTHHRYTGNRDGTMMGARPGKENMQAKIAHYQTPINNLLLSGHWAELGGGVPVAVRASVNTTLITLRKMKHPVFKSFAKYIDGNMKPEDFNQAPGVEQYPNDWKPKPTPATKKKLRAQSNDEAITS